MKTQILASQPAGGGNSIVTIQLPVSNEHGIPMVADFMAEVQRRFEVEKNAKNFAYDFILSNGLYDAFVEFSRQRKNSHE